MTAQIVQFPGNERPSYHRGNADILILPAIRIERQDDDSSPPVVALAAPAPHPDQGETRVMSFDINHFNTSHFVANAVDSGGTCWLEIIGHGSSSYGKTPYAGSLTFFFDGEHRADVAMAYQVAINGVTARILRGEDVGLPEPKPQMLEALKDALEQIDEEIEQRKNGGNDESWAQLQAVSDRVLAAIKAAEPPVVVTPPAPVPQDAPDLSHDHNEILF